MESLTLRQQTILNCVINAHVESALPVGSLLITEQYPLNLSPATVRHEMGALEELGYLMHPHTSSGRVPTDQGYRYYVDHCVEEKESSFALTGPVVNDLSEASSEVEFFAEKVSTLLAILSEEAGMVMLQEPSERDSGNRRRSRLFLQGSSHILEKPEFQDVQKVRLLFKAFEEKKDLAQWLDQQSHESCVMVTIGHENEPEALQDCAVVTMRYAWKDHSGGTLAIVGPRRMRYGRTISLVRAMADLIHTVFETKELD
jgi:transcriptional regulator of heat shock response